jgi:hypothetical protein
MLSGRLNNPVFWLLMFREYVMTWSIKPLMVTFGAGAWAYAMGAARATRPKAIIRTATTLVLFIKNLLIRWMTCIAATFCAY